MHEAQTPDDGAYIQNFNSVDSSQSPRLATNPFNSILTGESNAKKLLLLAPASEETPQNQTVNSSEGEEIPEYTVEIVIDPQSQESSQFDDEIDLENPPQDDWVAEPNLEQQAIVNGEFQQLLELNEELRSANNKLYEQVEELTNALSDSEAGLGQQKKRSSVAESMLKQQTQELNAAQAQIQSLFEQLENALQNVQRHESVAQSYKDQLELNQQRLAQLERECVSIQTKYSEQSQLLSQSENACRELRTRLKRQQRQTLQFKAALEKSLETSIPGYDTLDDNDSDFLGITTNSKVNKSKQTQSITSVQSIQPWSATADSDNTQSDLWEEIITTAVPNVEEYPTQEESSTWEFSANPDIQPIEDTPEPQTEAFENDYLGDKEETENPVVSTSESSELEEQLDSVIQTFFASQTESELPKSPQEQDTETNEAKISNWKAIVEPFGTNNDDNIDNHQNSEPEDEHKFSFTSSMNDVINDETEDYWEEVSQFPAYDLPKDTASFEILSDTDHRTNSPSPLIYPKRPPKGRKSLASVELPSFPQKNDDEKG